MTSMDYLNFDLQITRAAQGYRVEADSPAGQSITSFMLPFSELELENFLLKLGRTARGTRRVDAPEVAAAKAFGERLFDTVFIDDLRACLRSSLDEASQRNTGLRIRLRLTDAPELADLPWEYLYHSANNRFLSLSVTTPLIRYLDLPERIRPLSVTPPLRMLVMIASPRGAAPLDVEREWRKLQMALSDLNQRGLVVLERIPATLSDLQQQLRRSSYHILHFVGHGGFDERTQDGVLLMEDDDGESDRVSGQDLGTLLHDHRSLRMAVLNACEGARGSRTDPFAGTAQSLEQQGIPAVIAMQFEVSDEAAITLAHEFYGSIADGYPVDAALAESRKALFAAGNRVEWGTPVLYLRASDGKIFDVALGSSVLVRAPAPVATPTPEASSQPAKAATHTHTKPAEQPAAATSENRYPVSGHGEHASSVKFDSALSSLAQGVAQPEEPYQAHSTLLESAATGEAAENILSGQTKRFLQWWLLATILGAILGTIAEGILDPLIDSLFVPFFAMCAIAVASQWLCLRLGMGFRSRWGVISSSVAISLWMAFVLTDLVANSLLTLGLLVCSAIPIIFWFTDRSRSL